MSIPVVDTQPQETSFVGSLRARTVLAQRFRFYKRAETQAVQHSLPRIDLSGLAVLDIGCRDGRDLLHPEFANAKSLHGVDIDRAAIFSGQAHHPNLALCISPAEQLPFESAQFDAIMSRVALPYTDIPLALSEIHRTLKPGGYLFLTMHDWRMQMSWLKIALQERAWKRVIDHLYIFAASMAYAFSGHCFARPWNGKIETFQTARRLQKDLQRAGFIIKRIERTAKHFEIEAIRDSE